MAGVKKAMRRGQDRRKAAGRQPTDGDTSAGQGEDPSIRMVEESAAARAERIRRLKAQIADGTYNPDPHEIARKLLESGF